MHSSWLNKACKSTHISWPGHKCLWNGVAADSGQEGARVRISVKDEQEVVWALGLQEVEFQHDWTLYTAIGLGWKDSSRGMVKALLSFHYIFTCKLLLHSDMIVVTPSIWREVRTKCYFWRVYDFGAIWKASMCEAHVCMPGMKSIPQYTNLSLTVRNLCKGSNKYRCLQNTNAPLPQHIKNKHDLWPWPLTWLSIGIIYSSRTIYLPSLKLLGQSVLELSVAQG